MSLTFTLKLLNDHQKGWYIQYVEDLTKELHKQYFFTVDYKQQTYHLASGQALQAFTNQLKKYNQDDFHIFKLNTFEYQIVMKQTLINKINKIGQEHV